ncbi:hypothetical protein Enr13x_41520 [Stieleria neptunia]|uniref:Tetratricopeptide repeat protein n=1 Tax=Stieleria neptunia TaxID=2527979 RepID=A0A518HTV8_9BACT|nr:tetratricopeptide repeat protein [Stieleria neptunia]QDV44288.1 hypothetical protein Enr13x_41520 [Stieleria neptunia]
MFRAEVLWISVFLAIGAVGGLVYNWPSEPDVDVESPVALEPAPAVEGGGDVAAEPLGSEEIGATGDAEAVVREDPQGVLADPGTVSGIWNDAGPTSQRSQPIDFGVLELGDRLLLGGNSIGAVKHYSKLWQQANLPVDCAVLIRLGLASELAGLHEQAEKHYHSAIRVAKKGSAQQLVSLLGLARLWEREGQLGEAIALLGELFLVYSHEGHPEIIRQSIIHQLADCLQRRLLASEVVVEALRKEPMEYHWCPVMVEPILELADFESPADPPANPASGLKLLQDYDGGVSLMLVQAHLEGISVLELISELQRLAGLQVEVTEQAKSALVGRLADVDSPVMPVSMLLDHTLEPLSLAWSQSEGVLTIMARDELTSKDLASFDLARTQRTLLQVQLEFKSSVERTAAAIMNDGNNARLSGGWDVAVEKYRSARDLDPADELSAQLYFNEASLSLVRGEKLNALHSSYMALDQTLSAKLQAQVYAMIADLELEFGQLEKSITAASRGLRRAAEPAVFARTAMTLAKAYLLTGDPYSANAVLFDASADLAGESLGRLASVFSSFARFQHVGPTLGLQDEGQRVVLALAALQPDDVASFADALIVSKAYSAVGLRSKAIDRLSEALDIAPAGYWNERIRLQLAEMYYASQALDKANETIESFGTVSAGLLPKVLYLHASVQLDLGNLEQSETICRRLLGMNLDQGIQSSALEKLGETLQRSGDHYAAALCFAGLLPKSEGTAPETDGEAAVSP